MNKERLCVVMPVYNEQAAICGVLKKWASALESLGIDYLICPYDDGSKDSSLRLMREFAEEHPQYRIDVRSKANGGHGHTILTGYRQAVEDGFDWVFQIDSDDEMGPEHFEDLWRRRESFDFLVGRRAGRCQALARKIVSFISRLTVRLLYGEGRVWDVNAPYRLMRVPALAKVFRSIPLTTFAPNVIVTGMVARLGLRALEQPVPQHERTTGEVSIRRSKLLKAAVRSLAQTVLYSVGLHGCGGSSRLFCAFLAAFPVLVSLCTIDLTSVIWYDELCMGDGVFMKALHGLSWSGVWACSYNPLYPLLLTVWVWVFGATHFVLCSFTVLMGYIACLVLLGICHRRRFFSGILPDSAFILTFWGGWHLAWILSVARVDILVLLLSALFVDALVGYADRRTTKHVFVWGLFLFLASPYMLPLLFFLGLLLLVLAPDWRARKEVFRRGFSATAGFALGFLVVVAYYFAQRDLIRLLGSYVYFNSITGYSPAPWGERLFAAYGYDIFASVLAVGCFVLALCRRKYLVIASFVGAIPLLMLLGGRYESYYAWAFFVPVLLLTVTMFTQSVRWGLWLLMVAGGLSIVIRPFVKFRETVETRQVHEVCRLFVERNADRFKPGDDVVVAADLDGCTGFYYPLVQKGVHVWYRGAEMLNGRTDEEKFSEGLSFIAQSDESRRKMRQLIAKIQRFMPLLPEQGYVMFYTPSDRDVLLPLYERHGRRLREVDSDGMRFLYAMEVCKEE